MICNLSEQCSLRCLVVLLRLLLVPQLLVACGASSSIEDAAVSGKSGIGLGQAPNILTKAIEPAQLRPIVSMNGTVVSAERASDGSWFVDYTLFDSSLQVEMSWVESYAGQDLTLASWGGSFNNISASSTFTIPIEQYETDSHDNDSDGMSNLAERIADSDPYTRPFSATDIRGVWIGPCNELDNNFDFGQLAVTFGPTSYQFSVVSYANPDGCTGTNYASVNLLGSYIVTAETTELDDGIANHFDVIHRNGTISAGDDFIDALASIGTSLQDIYAADEGFENINDVPLEALEVDETYFSIFRIDGDQLFIGIETVLRDGTSAERRHNMLDVENALIKL